MRMLLLAVMLIGSSLAIPGPITAEYESCSTDEFKCLDLVCIPNTKVCDGEKDCFLHEDEVNCPKEKKGCESLGCSHKCLEGPDGASCYCDEGMQLDATGRECEDIDECKEYGICSQICTNGHGNYSCSCYPNYKLIKGSCYVRGEDPVLYITAKDSILSLNVRTNRTELIVEGLKKPFIGVAYNGLDNKIYWTDVDTNMVESMDKDAKQRTVLADGWNTPESIIVDEVSGNFYVSNSEKGQIVTCSLDGITCAVIDDESDKPRGLAIHYKEKLLFFTDWGSKPAVIRIGLDGSERHEIATETLEWPNGVAVDQLMDRVYWADAKFDTIESANLDGSDRRIALHDIGVIHPFSLAVFEDTLYWSDWANEQVASCNKYTGKQCKVYIKDVNLMGITLYHSSLQSGLVNPCLDHQCSHLCLPKPKGSSYAYTCACPDQMKLEEDSKTCVKENSRSLIIAVNNKLFSLNTTVMDLNVIQPVVSISGKVKYMATDKMNGELFVFNNESDIYKINLYEKNKKLISTNLFMSHLAYDFIDENIYWIDSQRKSIFLHSLTTQATKEIIKNLVNPKALFFSTKYRCIIFMDGRKVESASPQGVHLKLIKDNLPTTIQHVHFVDSYHTLLLGDSSSAVVHQLDLNSGLLDVFFTGIHSIGSMTVFNNRFYWTQHIGNELFWIKFQKNMTLDDISWMSLSPISDSPLNSVLLGVSSNSTTLDKDVLKPCQQASCLQFCFSYSGEAMCGCEDDFYLQEDGKSCHSLVSQITTPEADNNPQSN